MRTETDQILQLKPGQIELLKLLAVAFMAIDHINSIIYGRELLWMMCIGRMAFPLFCFVAAYNYEYHVRHIKKYLMLLFGFGIVSQPFYSWAMDNMQLNVFFTLGLGVLAIWIYDKRQLLFGRFNPIFRALIWLLIVVLFGAVGYFADYYQAGIILIPCIVLWLRHKDDLILFTVLLATMAGNFFQFFSIFALLSYPLIWLVASWNVSIKRLPRYFYYAFYPAHLALLKLFYIQYLQ